MSLVIFIPCLNEAAAIAQVVADLRAQAPEARIVVFDNDSYDATIAVAASAGAEVRRVPQRGKGEVVRRALADLDAELYLMIDGDGTYPAAALPALLTARTVHAADMVVGARQATAQASWRAGHRTGNRLFQWFLSWLFGQRTGDVFSGYRLFTRRFVKSFPASSRGFEIETELTVHALVLRAPTVEVPVAYGERMAGSSSKLNTWRDGLRILRTMLTLFAVERPLLCLGGLGVLLATTALLLAWPLLGTWLETGLVPRLPTALLATGMVVLAGIFVLVGVVLDQIARARREARQLAYLATPPPPDIRS